MLTCSMLGVLLHEPRPPEVLATCNTLLIVGLPRLWVFAVAEQCPLTSLIPAKSSWLWLQRREVCKHDDSFGDIYNVYIISLQNRKQSYEGFSNFLIPRPLYNYSSTPHFGLSVTSADLHIISGIYQAIRCQQEPKCNYHNSGHSPPTCLLFRTQLNSIGLFVPHRKHITSPLRDQQVMLSIGLWWWYINVTITILDVIHRPVSYLKLDSTL
jgi:hypothetical protein